MKICRTLNITEYAGNQYPGDCNCINPTIPPIIFPDNYVYSSQDLILYDYSPTQYIVVLGALPCSIGQQAGSNGNWGGSYIKYSLPFSIQVIGTNPANVSFIIIPSSGLNFTFTSTIFGWSVTNLISGLCMIVDKDVLTPDIPKASITTIGVKMNASSTMYLQQIKTEQFFNFNCDKYASKFNFITIMNQVFGFPSTQVMISGGAIDNGTTYKLPIARQRGSLSTWYQMIPYYSMRDVRILGTSVISVPDPGVTFYYDYNDGVWYAVIPKINGTYYTNSNPLLQLELETDTYIARTGTEIMSILQGTVTQTSGFLKIGTETYPGDTLQFVSNQWV